MPRKNGYGRGFFVYLMGAEGLFENKIGHTNSSPEKRKIELNVGSPRELFVVTWCELESERDMKTLERYLHYEFDRQRLRGEWFEYIPCAEFHRAADRSTITILNRGRDGRKYVKCQPRNYPRVFGDAHIVDIMPRVIENTAEHSETAA
jgi:hypothetical protein